MKKKLFFPVIILITLLFLWSCEHFSEMVQETPEGYRILEGKNLVVVLQTPLSSNLNRRGDSFLAELKEPVIFEDKIVLLEKTQIKGLVKRATKFEKLRSRANLFLLFDQIILPDGRKIPLAASLDTKKGSKVIRVKGEAVKDVMVIGSSALLGSLTAKGRGRDDTKQGLIVGAVAGTGVVLLSNAVEIKLPVGTELTIKLDEPLIIPK